MPKSIDFFAKINSKFWLLLNNPAIKFPKTWNILLKWRNFAKCGHTGGGHHVLFYFVVFPRFETHLIVNVRQILE